jgi:hypothetical protein
MSSRRQNTAAKTQQPKHKLQVDKATKDTNHIVTKTRQSGRFVQSRTTTIQGVKRLSVQREEGIDDDLESAETGSMTTGCYTSDDDDEQQEEQLQPVAKRGKYYDKTTNNNNATEEDHPAATEDPRRIISELQAKIDLLEQTIKEWEEREKDRSVYTTPAGDVPPMMLNAAEKAQVGKYTAQYIFPKIKFVNEWLFTNSPCIMKDCMDYLGIKTRLGKIQIWAACKKRIANVLSQQRYSTIDRMKQKCIGKCLRNEKHLLVQTSIQLFTKSKLANLLVLVCDEVVLVLVSF